jgi:hypothetical protein
MRWALAWALYAAGDICYFWCNKLMAWSGRVQGPSANGPWNVVEIDPEEFAHLEECMNNPQGPGPAPALLKGMDLIRSLRSTTSRD